MGEGGVWVMLKGLAGLRLLAVVTGMMLASIGIGVEASCEG